MKKILIIFFFFLSAKSTLAQNGIRTPKQIDSIDFKINHTSKFKTINHDGIIKAKGKNKSKVGLNSYWKF